MTEDLRSLHERIAAARTRLLPPPDEASAPPLRKSDPLLDLRYMLGCAGLIGLVQVLHAQGMPWLLAWLVGIAVLLAASPFLRPGGRRRRGS